MELQNHMSQQAPPAPIEAARERRKRWLLTALVAGILLLNFLFRVQTSAMADWQQFSFYDPGTILKGDILLAKGYVPTVDFGYTHGLVSLLYGRVGFAILGRTPWAYLLLTLATEFVMAFAIVRILRGAGVSRKGWLVFLAAIPMAIMPAYLTLTHPLEAMLILLALSEQVNNRRSSALAILAVCIFVKPSMAYVYGLLLVIIIVWKAFSKGGGKFREAAFALLPAVLTFALLFASLSLYFGVSPVIKTLLPLTGAKTYQTTHFGFFNESGKQFWMLPHILDYFRSATGIYLLAAAVSALGSIWAAKRLHSGDLDERPKLARAYELLFMTGLLNSAFLLGFYGWRESWTYYSYLPVLGLTMSVVLLPVRRNVRRVVALVLIAIISLSYWQLIGNIYVCYKTDVHTPLTGNDLWAQEDRSAEWADVLDHVGPRETLVLTYGYLRYLPPNVSMPDAWFPEPGIPTASEIARVKAQVDKSECIILTPFYGEPVTSSYGGDLDVWNSPDFAQYHAVFTPIYQGHYFTILQRNDLR